MHDQPIHEDLKIRRKSTMPLHKSQSGEIQVSSGSLPPIPGHYGGVEKASFSKVVEGLTHSQGSIALIAALLAGFAFQALTTLSITYDELNYTRKVLYIIFSVSCTITIASFLYVAVSCSMLEQR